MGLTIAEAARRVGLARSTLYEMNQKGKLSFTQSPTGKKAIEWSELSRVFPHVLFENQTNQTQNNTHHPPTVTDTNQDLKAMIEEL